MIQSAKYVIHISWFLAASCCHGQWKVAKLQAVYTPILDCNSYFQGFLSMWMKAVFVSQQGLFMCQVSEFREACQIIQNKVSLK